VMNPQSIAELFATSLNPDPNVRKAGEIEIRHVRLARQTNKTCFH